MNRPILAPSILSADFAHLADDITAVTKAGAGYLHIDVMDGIFVPSISLGMPVIKSIRKVTDAVFDVHLMITQPERYIKEFAQSGADIITIHVEATKDPAAVLEQIRSYGVKTCISLNPVTPLSAIEPYLAQCDMVLIMSVNPGFGGQKYIETSTQKVKDLAAMRAALGLDFDIEIDGGVKLDNVRMIRDAGADVIVAGSAVFGGDAGANVKKFLEAMND